MRVSGESLARTREDATHRFFSYVVNAVRTAVVVTGEKKCRKREVEIGLRFGNEVCVSHNDGVGFIVGEAFGMPRLDKVEANGHCSKDRTDVHV